MSNGVLELNFNVVHPREKTYEGQKHLDENRQKWNMDAWDILLGMLDGKRFNHPACTASLLTLSLSSRISELGKSNYQVKVSKEWVREGGKPDGKKLYKEYFLTPEEADRIRRLIVSNLKFIKKSK